MFPLKTSNIIRPYKAIDHKNLNQTDNLSVWKSDLLIF